MSSSSVVYLRPRGRPETPAPNAPPRVLQAFGVALLRSPPKPAGLAACIAYLQEGAEQLQRRHMGIRALGNLRSGLFNAPGREPEMRLLWREALATACYAHEIATQARFNAPLLTGAGLLHRAGDIAALQALAQAEREAGQRLMGPVMQEILNAQDDELVARVTRCWALSGELRMLILRWRVEQDHAQYPEAVGLLTMAQALATAMVHRATCTPGLVEAARETLRVPESLVSQAQRATPGIEALLEGIAPR
jgi:hypothetical protein